MKIDGSYHWIEGKQSEVIEDFTMEDLRETL
jgi:hypothetical protein